MSLRELIRRAGLLSGLTWAFVAAAAGQIKAGDVFPALPAGMPSTAGKIVLVDFWASWCAPCKGSFPAYNRLVHDFQAKGLVVVGLSVDEEASAYESFVKHAKPEFMVARDADHSVVGQVRVPTMPTSYLIDRSGHVRFVHPGFRGAETETALRMQIETLLAEKTS